MLKGGWLPGIAIILILLFAIWVGLKIGYQDGYGDGGDDATAYQHDGTISDGAAPESGISNEQTKRDEWRDEEDLNAQRNMAYWAAAMFLAASATFFVTGLGVVYVAQTLDATRAAVEATNRATDETRQIGEAQVRAYIGGHEAEIVRAKDGRGFFLNYSLKNYGQSPARKIEVFFALIYLHARSIGEWPEKTEIPMNGTFPRDIGAGGIRDGTVFIDEVTINTVSAFAAADLRFHCRLQVLWWDVFDKRDKIIVTLSQPLDTFDSNHWVGKLRVADSEWK